MSRDLAMQADELEERLRNCFPNHELADHGTNAFDYLVGNIRCAVTDEIIAVIESWLHTVDQASHIAHLNKNVPARDWEVAKAHIIDLISEIKQYKTRGNDNHTGAVRVIDID